MKILELVEDYKKAKDDYHKALKIMDTAKEKNNLNGKKFIQYCVQNLYPEYRLAVKSISKVHFYENLFNDIENTFNLEAYEDVE